MSFHALYGVTVEVCCNRVSLQDEIDVMLHRLSFQAARRASSGPAIRFRLRVGDAAPPVPPGRPDFVADGIAALERDEDFYLTDGSSVLHLRAEQGTATAYLNPSFFDRPLGFRQCFLAFALMRLLRPRGLYCLHAAGLLSQTGIGVLIAGPSGCGKSTLTLELVQRGWKYLSDDVVLLRRTAGAVEALALRRSLDVTLSRFSESAAGVPSAGQPGLKAQLDGCFSGQQTHACAPRILLLPRIVREPPTILERMPQAEALGELLAASGPQLFDRRRSAEQLALLCRLVKQADVYRVDSGPDLHDQIGKLEALLPAGERSR